MIRAMKHLAVLARSFAGIALATACQIISIPRYARGDLESQGYEKIPAGSSFAVRRSLAANSIDRPIARRISQTLRQAGYRETSEAEADALLWYVHSVEGEPATRSGSEGVEAVWDEGQQLHECPSRFSQRLTIFATRARTGERLWQGELCSDGGGRDPSEHAGAFAREVIKSYGMRREKTRFEIRLRPASASRTCVPN